MPAQSSVFDRHSPLSALSIVQPPGRRQSMRHFDMVFLMDRLQGSSSRYPLDTDQLGRARGAQGDFASRLIYGARLTPARSVRR